MMVKEELETYRHVRLDYRRLWLDSEDELGLIAEILADVLGWQPTEVEPLPNALELAEVAAQRVIDLEILAAGTQGGHIVSSAFRANSGNQRGKSRAKGLHIPDLVLN